MNIHQDLQEDFKYISKFNGVCLNIEEKFKLELALNELHLDIKSEEMWFWGKIIGIEKDYYIAIALFFTEHYQFPKKKFFFCNSVNFVFSELPEVQNHHLADLANFNTYFIGNPDIILENYENNNNDDNLNINEDENTFVVNKRLKSLTESDRLAYVVRCIDYDTTIVPVGAFKMLPINELRRNDNFTGKF
jgi:radial spoke head protein 9